MVQASQSGGVSLSRTEVKLTPKPGQKDLVGKTRGLDVQGEKGFHQVTRASPYLPTLVPMLWDSTQHPGHDTGTKVV